MLFPAIATLAGGPAEFPFGSVANPIRVMLMEHDRAGELLVELARRHRWLRRAGRRLRQLPLAVRTARRAGAGHAPAHPQGEPRPVPGRASPGGAGGGQRLTRTHGGCAPTPHRRPACWRTLGRGGSAAAYAPCDGVGAAAGRRRAADRPGDHDPPPDRGRAAGARSARPSPTSRRRPATRSSPRLAGAVTAGMTVAVGAGSRGLTGRVELLRGTIAGLRDLGAEPFVVPAMGSHGGATAEGQLAMLADARHDRRTRVGAEIRSTMETVVVAHDAVRPAAAPRHPRRRRRPHPARSTGSSRTPRSTGPIESGCTKMAVVGFGKQPGAAAVPRQRRRRACATSCSTASPRCAPPAGCSAAWRRSRRRPATSSRCARCTPTRSAAPPSVELTDAGPGARRRAAVRRDRRAGHRARAARTSPARRSTPTSPAASGSTGSPTRRRRGWR